MQYAPSIETWTFFGKEEISSLNTRKEMVLSSYHLQRMKFATFESAFMHKLAEGSESRKSNGIWPQI